MCKQVKIGITFSISTNKKDDLWNKFDDYCKLKMYQTKYTEWILITIGIGENDNQSWDFRIYEAEWKEDKDMEEKLDKVKALRIAEFKKTGQKIGRNDLCPCNSGLKYKKCCGK